MADAEPRIRVSALTMAFGSFVVQRDLDFTIGRGEIFALMGGSGCGKSTLMKHMIGLIRPAKGDVFYDGESFWQASDDRRQEIGRRFGVTFQGGALWSSMTLAENVALPLQQYSDLDRAAVRELVSLKLAFVGLRGFEDFYPSEISGGMRKRVGLARAIALDPDVLFFDEPSAGLDPLSSRRLDELIVQLRDSLGATIIMVTHELPTILSIVDRAIFLDAETKTAIDCGDPRQMIYHSPQARVREFLQRGEDKSEGAAPIPAGASA